MPGVYGSTSSGMSSMYSEGDACNNSGLPTAMTCNTGGWMPGVHSVFCRVYGSDELVLKSFYLFFWSQVFLHRSSSVTALHANLAHIF